MKKHYEKIDGAFKTDRNEYYLGDSIWINLSLTNISDKDVFVFIPTGRVQGLDIHVKENEGYETKSLVQEPDTGLIPELKLAPLESYVQQYLLSKWLKFKKAGNYTIECSIPIELADFSIRDKLTNRKLSSKTVFSVLNLRISTKGK